MSVTVHSVLAHNVRVGYLTAQEVADRLRLDVQVIYRRIREGALLAVNVGTDLRPQWRIDEDEYDRYVERRSRHPEDE